MKRVERRLIKYTNAVGLDLQKLIILENCLNLVQIYINCMLCIRYIQGNLNSQIINESLSIVMLLYRDPNYKKNLKDFELLKIELKVLIQNTLFVQKEINRICKRDVMSCSIGLYTSSVRFLLKEDNMKGIKITSEERSYINGLVNHCQELLENIARTRDILKKAPGPGTYGVAYTFLRRIPYIIEYAGYKSTGLTYDPTIVCPLLVEYAGELIFELFSNLANGGYIDSRMISVDTFSISIHFGRLNTLIDDFRLCLYDNGLKQKEQYVSLDCVNANLINIVISDLDNYINLMLCTGLFKNKGDKFYVNFNKYIGGDKIEKYLKVCTFLGNELMLLIKLRLEIYVKINEICHCDMLVYKIHFMSFHSYIYFNDNYYSKVKITREEAIYLNSLIGTYDDLCKKWDSLLLECSNKNSDVQYIKYFCFNIRKILSQLYSEKCSKVHIDAIDIFNISSEDSNIHECVDLLIVEETIKFFKELIEIEVSCISGIIPSFCFKGVPSHLFKDDIEQKIEDLLKSKKKYVK